MPPGDHMPMATGPTPMRDGHGCHTRISGGPLTIMDAGSGWPITAGSGDPVMNGAQPGSPGASVALTLVLPNSYPKERWIRMSFEHFGCTSYRSGRRVRLGPIH